MKLELLIFLVTGLGLFVFGTNLLGSGLQKMVGNQINGLVHLAARNRFLGILSGILITAIMQSSSATTVITVGFVNSEVLQLSHALAVIMGANIGTTLTGQIVSFPLESIAPITIGAGMICSLIQFSGRIKSMSETFLGFGILFVGMYYLKKAAALVALIPGVESFVGLFATFPLLGIMIGLTATLLLRKSSASIAIMLSLGSAGVLPIESALPILYGDNIGTCVTAILSGVGADKNANRAAVMHLIFNVIGTLLFATILHGLIISSVIFLNPQDAMRQIANAHTLFNIISAAIQFPFSVFIVRLSQLIISPDAKESVRDPYLVQGLDVRVLSCPSIAVENTVCAALDTGDHMAKAMSLLYRIFKEDEPRDFISVEEEIQSMKTRERTIREYLEMLSAAELSLGDRHTINALFILMQELRNMSVASLRLLDYLKRIPREEGDIEAPAKNFIEALRQASEAVKEAMDSWRKKDIVLAEEIEYRRDAIHDLSDSLNGEAVYRMERKVFREEQELFYLLAMAQLERIIFHSVRIGQRFVDRCYYRDQL